MGLRFLGGADQKGQASGWLDQGGGGGEDGFETFDGAEGDYVVASGEGFGAGILYIDVRQCKSAGDFFQERGFLVIGFDQGEGDVRSPEFDGEAGEAGAAADVGNFQSFHRRGCGGRRGDQGKQMPACEEALAEVASDDVFGVADGGEVDAGVPAEEYIDVRRYILELGGGQDSRFLVATLLGMTSIG